MNQEINKKYVDKLRTKYNLHDLDHTVFPNNLMKAWIEALKSGEFIRGLGMLQQQEILEDGKEYTTCCALGVLAVIHSTMETGLPMSLKRDVYAYIKRHKGQNAAYKIYNANDFDYGADRLTDYNDVLPVILEL